MGIKNKYKTVAVALSYNAEEMETPLVSIVGEGDNANLMAKMARRYGVPLVSDPVLANKLSDLPECSEVPLNLYDDVARVFLSISSKS